MVRKSSPAGPFPRLPRVLVLSRRRRAVAVLARSRISTASRQLGVEQGEVLVGELAGGMVELGVADLAVLGFLQRVGLGADQGAAATAA